MKIQINSLEALERLIGGDSELEIEIRNSIVQEFAKKHLKCLAQTEVIATAVTDAKTIFTDFAKSEVTRQIGEVKRHWGTLSYNLEKDVINAIKDAVSRELRVTIAEHVESLAKKHVEGLDIEKFINKKIDTTIQEKIESGVRKRFEEVLKKTTEQ